MRNPVKDIQTNAADCSNRPTELIVIVTRHIMADSIYGYSCSIHGPINFLRGYIYSLYTPILFTKEDAHACRAYG